MWTILKNLVGLTLLLAGVTYWMISRFQWGLWGLYMVLFIVGMYRGLVVGLDFGEQNEHLISRIIPVFTTFFLVPVLHNYFTLVRKVNRPVIDLLIISFIVSMILKIFAHAIGTVCGMVIRFSS